MKKTVLIKVSLPEGVDPVALYGAHDRHIRSMEKAFGVKVGGRGEHLIIEGEAEWAAQAEKAILDLAILSKEGFRLTSEDVSYAIRSAKQEPPTPLEQVYPQDSIPIFGKKKCITPKSRSQQNYIEMIRNYDLVFGIGPAGTGKTYLAMAMAISALMNKEVHRIILARPAVEAGEKLGFLPGDMIEKVNPYLRPLYDALYDMMEMERAHRLIERGDIEIAPLAFMRGRTLNDSFIVLDEAQNTTSEQMKMFLTRMGFRSKSVITGDITQIDLPESRASGLVEIQDILKDISGIKFAYFTEKDVVRHSLVQEIVKAYDHLQKKADHVQHHGSHSKSAEKTSHR
jgi:phosphate starvation-inducible PhoH-like protein